MGRLENTIEQLRQEIAAFEARHRAPTTTPEEEAKWLEVAGYMVRGEAVPEALLDDLDPLAEMRDFLPVAQQMLEEGLFDVAEDDGEDPKIVKDGWTAPMTENGGESYTTSEAAKVLRVSTARVRTPAGPRRPM